ncbi:MAG: ADP-forming succinate--CoA ligase subunit beta [Methanobacterium sp.]|uniref:ADP-forming succinate--CoA ligase subunit beta n=1 Tax=Methanobacterium sp. TaxID=2164 RepID=UPI003D6628C6|nr:ADP-forming succinate--CoA ligase subunit beta [Methanobacterium sp.]
MKFFEYSAKEIFKNAGIPVPSSYVVNNPQEALKAAENINKPVALKSQVLIGGRGKAGGIKFADTPEDAQTVAEELLGIKIKGEPVNKVLVEEKINIQSEFYISVVMDRSAKKPLIMASTEGGVDIEEVALKNPDKIIKYHVNPLDEFMPYQSRGIAAKMGIPNEMISSMAGFIHKLFNVFKKYDATIAEINPLVLTPEGLIAADAKLEIDDDALWRHKEFSDMEESKKDEFAYVTLDGDIAVIGNGAGLTLTGMDMINLYGGNPATFLDIGGGASQSNIARAINLVIAEPNVKVIFLNVLGGITRADDVANGVIDVLDSAEREVPLVIRLTGTNEEEGQRILTEAGVSFETSMEDAAQKAVELCNAL